MRKLLLLSLISLMGLSAKANRLALNEKALQEYKISVLKMITDNSYKCIQYLVKNGAKLNESSSNVPDENLLAISLSTSGVFLYEEFFKNGRTPTLIFRSIQPRFMPPNPPVNTVLSVVRLNKDLKSILHIDFVAHQPFPSVPIPAFAFHPSLIENGVPVTVWRCEPKQNEKQ